MSLEKKYYLNQHWGDSWLLNSFPNEQFTDPDPFNWEGNYAFETGLCYLGKTPILP